MVYVVEIANRDNERATKEYLALSRRDLLLLINHDLEHHPSFRLVNAWPKDQPSRLIFVPVP